MKICNDTTWTLEDTGARCDECGYFVYGRIDVVNRVHIQKGSMNITEKLKDLVARGLLRTAFRSIQLSNYILGASPYMIRMFFRDYNYTLRAKHDPKGTGILVDQEWGKF